MASVADVVAVQQPRAAFPHVAALDFVATEGAPGGIFGSAIGHDKQRIEKIESHVRTLHTELYVAAVHALYVACVQFAA